MPGGFSNFVRRDGGALRAGWWRWPLAWLVATGLLVGVLVVSWLAWQRPTDLLALGEPPPPPPPAASRWSRGGC